MSADLLLRAAAKLRGDAKQIEHLTPPWSVHPGDSGRWLVGCTTADPYAGLVATVPDYGGMAMADWIALMSPALTEPLAAWLEATARAMGWLEPYRPHEQGYEMWASAIAFARAVLGEEA